MTIPQPQPARRSPHHLVLAGLGSALIALIILRLWGFELPQGAGREAILSLRVTRVASASIVGASLGLAGLLLQSFLRNPLASPDLLGMASGGGLGLMLAVALSWRLTGLLADPGPLGATACSLAGALGALGLVWALARRRGIGLEPTSVVLVGVVVSIVAASGIGLVQHMLPDRGVSAARLLVGTLREDVSMTTLAWTGGLCVACVALALVLARSMDAATLSDDEARSVGVALGRLRVMLVVLAGVLTAISVVLAGPLAFVGLLAPHAARLLLGPRHGPRVLASVLIGAGALVAGDCAIQGLAVALPSVGRLPLGVLTSVVGGPVFLVLLRRGPHASR